MSMRAVGVGLVFLVGCSSATTARSTASTTTATTVSSVTTTAAAPTTTTVAATTTTVAPINVSAGPCAIGDPMPNGAEVTFVRGAKLVGISSPYSDRYNERCLAELAPGDDGTILWGPQGDRFLIGNQTFVVADQRTPTGFAPTDVATWSAPKGSAILRLDPLTHVVSKRNNIDNTTITPLPVMAEAYDALYHPAGRNIAVVGRPTPASTYGIWLITNDGANPKLITGGEETKRIRLQRWENGGFALVFWAEHLDGAEHVHRLALPGLTLDDANPGTSTKLQAQDRHLPGDLPEVDCPAGDATLQLPLVTGGKTVPVTARTIRTVRSTEWAFFFATRTSTCDGPEDLWAWNLGRSFEKPVKLAEGVTSLIVRDVVGAANELPDDLTAQAPG
jgi:hypothetical protein